MQYIFIGHLPTALPSPKRKARIGEISPFSVKYIIPGMWHPPRTLKDLVMKGSKMRLRSPVAQGRKLVVREFPLHPLAHRRERNWMRWHHFQLPLAGFFLPSSVIWAKAQRTVAVREKYWNTREKRPGRFDTLFPTGVSSFSSCPLGIIALTMFLLIEDNSVNSANCANARELQNWNSPKHWGIMIQGGMALIHLFK